MLQRLKNYFRYGMLATDEHLGIRNPMRERMEEMEQRQQERLKENKDQAPVTLEKDDRKALFIAAVQVLGPIILFLLVIVFLLFYITARFFA